MTTCRAYLRSVADAAERVSLDEMETLRVMVSDTWSQDRTLWVAGNGGSATVAEHLALGMSLNVFRETGHGAKAFSLSASGAFVSAAANDFGRDRMFAAQVEALARSNDLLLAISASGKSANLVHAVDTANRLGLRTAAIVGEQGGISERCEAFVDLGVTHSAIAEDVTIMLLHWLYCSFMEPAHV